MKEPQFIELAIRYLDGAANQAEVDELGAAMLAQPELRILYRELVQQAQLAHESHTTTAATTTADVPQRSRVGLWIGAAAAAAAAAAIIAAAIIFDGEPKSHEETSGPAVAGTKQPGFFDDRDPSWSDIYHSPFDYPEFVWRAEISADAPDSEVIDAFTEGGAPPLLAATPTPEFNRLLAPIVFLPRGEELGSGLY